jgi:hypothetical protein
MITFKKYLEEIKKPTGDLKKACWTGYTAVGTKQKNGRTVPNCVPEEVELVEMDKTQTPPGRDGNSVYDPEAHAGKKAYTGKPVTSNKVKKDMLKLLNKNFNKEEIEKLFDVIEEMVEEAATEHNIDSELLWERLESVSDEELIEESAAWQRKAGKDPKGGLNRKGIASYRAQHPGSHLSMAVTTKPSKLKPGSKAANRRKSFCARMGGMEGAMKKPNGEPTRKALALRKWHC